MPTIPPWRNPFETGPLATWAPSPRTGDVEVSLTPGAHVSDLAAVLADVLGTVPGDAVFTHHRSNAGSATVLAFRPVPGEPDPVPAQQAGPAPGGGWRPTHALPAGGREAALAGLPAAARRAVAEVAAGVVLGFYDRDITPGGRPAPSRLTVVDLARLLRWRAGRLISPAPVVSRCPRA